MINYSTSLNKTLEIHVLDWDRTKECGRVKPINAISTDSDNWISNENTDINKQKCLRQVEHIRCHLLQK